LPSTRAARFLLYPFLFPANVGGMMKHQRLICMGLLAIAAGRPVVAGSPVEIDYFYQDGCPACARVNGEVLPELTTRYDGFFRLNRFNIGNSRSAALLMAYQQALGMADNEPVCMVVDRRQVLSGVEAIRDGLFAALDDALAKRALPGWEPAPSIEVPPDKAAAVAVARDRFGGFTLPAVMLGGLLDGINPCAIGTMIFFMSLLAVSGVGGSRLLIMGGAYCAAMFLTYLALGWGLLHLLHRLAAFETLRVLLERGMAVLLAGLAALSFADAWRYGRTGKTGTIRLQLPAGIRQAIHRVMRGGIRHRHLAVGGAIAGGLVTLLESVCTGQVYLPVLVMLAGTGSRVSPTAWMYLLIYNAAFMLPLLLVFGLTYAGVGTPRFLNWSRRNVIPSKLLLGLFFLLLGALLLMF